MRIIQIEKELYRYNELPEEVKEEVRRDYENQYFDSWFYEDFTEEALRILQSKFPHSKLKIQADFSRCQGSGCNIFGNFNLLDYPEKYVNKDDLRWFVEVVPEIELQTNYKYTYSLHTEEHAMVEEEVIVEIFNWYAHYYNLTPEGEEKVGEIVKNIFSEIEETEQELYRMGEEMLNIDGETIAEIAECNGWEYLADGSLWTGK